MSPLVVDIEFLMMKTCLYYILKIKNSKNKVCKYNFMGHLTVE